MKKAGLKFVAGIAATVVMSSIAANAVAADPYPNRQVKIIVPFGPAGVADALPRIVGQKLSTMWGVPVVIENKAGAAGNIGMAEGARSAPDGYTLVLAPAGNLTVNPVLFPKLTFNTSKDFAPVTVLATSPNVLVVNPAVPAATLKDLIAYAKANPGKLNYSSPGTGTGAHLAGELLNQSAGIDAVHVPYNGMAPAVNDVLAGQVQMIFAGVSTVVQHVQSGKLRALAVAGPQRLAVLPNVPTVAESGYPGFDVTSWYGLIVRAGTPDEIVQKLYRDISFVLKQDDIKAKFAGLGVDPLGNTPQAFGTMIKTESKKWTDIVHKANIQPLE
jgi:tripartite-type tricarboxylate transporter receptor subunit TctC